jgi:hypothetical protein
MRKLLLEKTVVIQLVKKFSKFYGIKDSLPHSRARAIGPFLVPDNSSQYPHNLLVKIHFNITHVRTHKHPKHLTLISGFRRDVDEICALLGYSDS